MVWGPLPDQTGQGLREFCGRDVPETRSWIRPCTQELYHCYCPSCNCVYVGVTVSQGVRHALIGNTRSRATKKVLHQNKSHEHQQNNSKLMQKQQIFCHCEIFKWGKLKCTPSAKKQPHSHARRIVRKRPWGPRPSLTYFSCTLRRMTCDFSSTSMI